MTKKKKRVKLSIPFEKKRNITASLLLSRTLKTYVKVLPQITLVALAGSLPLQLFIAWLIEQQEGDSALMMMQYQGLGDWVFGSLIVAALYNTIYDAVIGADDKGLIATLISSYKRGLRAWVGMFVTRMMVSIAVGVSAAPTLAAFWAIGKFWPDMPQVSLVEGNVPTEAWGKLAPLILATPLLALPIMLYLWYVLTEIVVAVERIDGFSALQRSRELTRGIRWKILAGLAPLVIPLQILSFWLLGISEALGPWLSGLLTALTMVIIAIVGTFLAHVYVAQGGTGRPEPKEES